MPEQIKNNLDERQAPLFSVVIPTFNRSGLISKAIQSILEQSVREFEIIVVDNGSTDNTEDVVRSFKDPRIVYHRQKGTGTPAGPRNTGVRLARGKYVSFLDSDDWWYPGKLQAVAQAVREKPDSVLICHSFDFVREADLITVHKHSFPRIRSSYYEELIAGGNFIGTSACTVLRETFLLNSGFCEEEGFVAVEDWDLWIRIAKSSNNFVLIDTSFTAILVHGGNTFRISEDLLRRLQNVIERQGDFINSRPDVRRKVEARMEFLYARLCHIGGEFSSAFMKYLRSCISLYKPLDSIAGMALCLVCYRY